MTTTPTTALTLHRPWAAAILYSTKRTENRSWAPKRLPGRIGLHAGRTLDPAGVARLTAHLASDLPANPYHQGLVGTAVVVATHPAARCPRGDSCRVWGASTGWHWILEDVHALERPVRATGRQKLWRLTKEQKQALRSAKPVPDPSQELALDAAGTDLAELLLCAMRKSR